MARPLKQSTSVDVPIGPFLDATDGITPETALTITQPDVRLKKNAAAWAQKAAAQTLSHEENGFYEVTLDATDTDTLGLLRLAVFESGACPVWEDFVVLSANNYDSAVAASDNLQVDAIQFAGQTITAAAGVTLPSSVASPTNITAAAGCAVSSIGANVITAASTAADFIAEVNAEVVDALNTDTYAEPGQGTPGATISLAAKIGYLYKAWRNRSTQTATEYALYADDAVTKDHEAIVSDDATTLDRGEVSTGA